MKLLEPHDRRSFLRAAALSAGGAAIGGAAIAAAPLFAADPVPRSGKAKFKFSLAAYSYRNLLSGDSPKMKLEDFIADCAAMGLEGTELTSYYFPKDVTPDYLRHLKYEAFRLGLDVSGTAVRNEFCHPSGPERDRELAEMKRWIDCAELLGAPVIRIFSGSARKGQTPEEAHKLAVSGMEESAHYAGQHGVFLALENHGGLSTKIDDLLKLVGDVKSPWFGINLDTGNFQGCSTADEAYADMEKMAPYALNVQVKVAIAVKGKKVPSDFSRLARILSSSGYRGYIVLEYEESEDPRTACPKHIEELRKAFA